MLYFVKVTLLILIFVFQQGEGYSEEVEEVSVNLAVDFELQDLSGKTHNLSGYFKEGTVVVWFTNFCGGCQKALPELREVFFEKAVNLLIISLLGDDVETPQDMVKQYQLPFSVLLDTDGKVCRQYSGNYIPDTCPLNNLYIINTAGKIVERTHYPGLDKSELTELLEK